MLFNSYAFLLAFLPVTVLGFFLAGRAGRSAGAAWLAACSLFFYAWWDHRYVALLLGSICGNYLLGSFIARRPGTIEARRVLILAISGNLTLLAYYKYADFFISSTNALLTADIPILGIVLPIGISFFTFTQIAYLVDAYSGKVSEYRFIHYALFVTYFPHLVAGPVLHHKEMMPQFDANWKCRLVPENFAVGLTIFSIGLAKKVLIADNLAIYASPVFASQAEGATLFVAWGGALAYTFQLYFDFSGYSDMAIGLSRLFGVKLPLNFDSPYKSGNISEFWRRWHMTLSRFLRDYLYIPLGGNRCGPFRRQINLMVTMLLGGLWHGAGANFIVWGGLHGAYLVAHQLWKHLSRGFLPAMPGRTGAIAAGGLTFLSVVVAWVYFRAPDLATAHRILLSMAGGFGAALPESILLRLGPVSEVLDAWGVQSFLGGGTTFVATWSWVFVAAAICWLAPNTQELLRHFEPALDPRRSGPAPAGQFVWRPSKRHALCVGVLFAFGVLALSSPTEFLYFQF